jgi:hypothetical protein
MTQADECLINDTYRNVLVLTFNDFIVNSESFTKRLFYEYFRKLSDPKLTPNPIYYHQFLVYKKYFPEIQLFVDAKSFPPDELQSFVYRNFDKLILKMHWLNFAHVHAIPTVQYIYEKFNCKLILPVVQQMSELVDNYDFVTDDVLHLLMRWCNFHTMTTKIKVAEILYDDLNNPQIQQDFNATKQVQKELKRLFKISGYNGDETIDEFMKKQIEEKLSKIKDGIHVSLLH